jgi:CRISP-associated protein Cas1
MPVAPDLLPVRMLNEFAYCPRLFHLEHVEGKWADNRFTLEGKEVHRRVDRFDDVLPDAVPGGEATEQEDPDDGDDPPEISRSVKLASERLGIIGKPDLVSTAGDEAVPVDTKRGSPPNNPERSWEPERVQLMAQGLLLREHGYRIEYGVLYFAGSRTRVDVPFTEELEARTLELIEEARAAAGRSEIPEPLEDSPKCNGCSLAGICLPDETLALREVPPDPVEEGWRAVRRLYPARDDAVPFYVQEQGARIGKSKKVLTVRKDGQELARVRLKDVSQVVLCGNVQISTQTVRLCCEAEVPVVYLSTGHWFYGITRGITLRNSFDRAAQFRLAAEEERCLELSRALVQAKGANQRTLLGRNARPRPDEALIRMKTILGKVEHAGSIEVLRGLEGNVAALYFRHFSRMLRPRDFDAEFDFEGRNRRPPRDPINALLSFGYALLAKECTVALMGEGLDPWWGFFHRPRHGRPALALDLMEEFRAVVVDSAVLTAVNTGMVARKDFRVTKAGCVLTAPARRAFIRAYEARLDQLVTHPIFDYRASWRSILRVQARLLCRWLRGDVPGYIGMTTR